MAGASDPLPVLEEGVLRDAGVVEMWWTGPKKRVRLRRGDLDARWPGLLDAVLKQDA